MNCELFYIEIDDIRGDWDEDTATEAIFFISDGPEEQGYPEPWFSIPNNSVICQQTKELISKYFPNYKYHWEIWNISVIE